MNYNDLEPEQQYYYDTAWSNLRLAYDMVKVGRKAKAQELLLEVRYFAQKVPAQFTDTELQQNIEKLYHQITFGF
jgi:hypothetical protein